MKKFIKRLLLFFLLWFIIAGAIDYYYTKKLQSSNIREIVIWEDIFKSRIDSDIVYLGSSRTADHYQPYIIDSILGTRSYNLGQYGQTIESDIMRYDLLSKYESQKPRLYIWDVYFNSFSLSSKYQDVQYTPYLFNKDIWNNVNKQTKHFSYIDKFLPLYRYWSKNVIPHYEALENPIRGFVYNYDKWNPDNNLILKKDTFSYSIDTLVYNSFCSTIQQMKKEGSNVAIVFSPLHKLGQDAVKDLDSFINLLQHTADKEKCIFINFIADPMCSDSSYFKNTMHLNEIGTDYFSAKFAHIVDSIGLIE